jgi:RNA polymerase sigma-70 factor (ECF subfamily)
MGDRLDREAVRRLYEEHARGLLAYACSYVTSFATAEDVLHHVFERVLRGDLSISGGPVAYLYRAVRNTALNKVRDRAGDVEWDDGWLESPAGMEHTALELQSTLRELPDEQREVIVLHIWGQMSFEEVAEALAISANTAASRYRYGLSKLREQFQANGVGRAEGSKEAAEGGVPRRSRGWARR